MSVIALDMIPTLWSYRKIVAVLCKRYGMDRQHFQILTTGDTKYGIKEKHKMVYLELHKAVIVKKVLMKLAYTQVPGAKIKALIPTSIPDISENPRFVTKKLLKKLVQPMSTSLMTFKTALKSILYELEVKYTGLFSLSQKWNHKLLHKICMVICKRMCAVIEKDPEDCKVVSNFTQTYRLYHPQSEDFNLVSRILAQVETEAGVPHTKLEEKDLIVAADVVIKDVAKIKEACRTYSDLITNELLSHIGILDSTCSPTDTPEETARKKIRNELQNVSPYLKDIMGQVLKLHFSSDLQKPPNEKKMMLIGEPKLPSEPKYIQFLEDFEATNVERSLHNYNIVIFEVPLAKAAEVFAMDSTVFAGCKLLMRSADTPCLYKIPESIQAEIDGFIDEKEDDTLI